MNATLEHCFVAANAPFDVCRFDGERVKLPREIKEDDGTAVKSIFWGAELSPGGIYIDDRGRAYCSRQHEISSNED